MAQTRPAFAPAPESPEVPAWQLPDASEKPVGRGRDLPRSHWVAIPLLRRARPTLRAGADPRPGRIPQGSAMFAMWAPPAWAPEFGDGRQSSRRRHGRETGDFDPALPTLVDNSCHSPAA